MFHFYEIKCKASPKEFAYFYLWVDKLYDLKNLYSGYYVPDGFRLCLIDQGYEAVSIKQLGLLKYFYHKYFKKPKDGYKVFWEKENHD